MPVFHTKTIEAILEPVAQQVSQLVVLHEEGEEGRAISDLSGPVLAVSSAVNNLVLVAKQTASSSKDEILRKEMPPAYTKVEEASNQLVEASQFLKDDPYSVPGRKSLINGARGILNATSALLLAFDDGEVRKILAVCRRVLDYIQVAEVVEVLPDCVTFLKNLSPGLLSMAQKVDGRIPDLTHQTHCELLQKHIKSAKMYAPLLINSMKAFISANNKNVGRAEAQENRNFIITKLCDDIIEIMRVLQLKVDDEYDLEDPCNLMRKNRHRLLEKMKLAKDWLNNPDSDPNGLGEKALRDIIKQARHVGALANDAGIKNLCDELDKMLDRLTALKAQGLGNSPEALRLAQEIDRKLGQLTKMVDDAIAREAAAGTRLPAVTTQGQFDQANRWIDDPRYDPNSVGRRAIDALVADGKRLAEQLTGAERKDLLDTIANIERLTKQLDDLKKAGKGNTPEALRIAAQLKKELEKLKGILEAGATKGVLESFMDILTPIKQLEKAAKASQDAPNREQDFEEKAGAFEYHTSKMIDAAEQTSIHGKNVSKQLVENIQSAAKDLAELTPQVSHAGKLLLLNPGDNAIETHFNQMKQSWINKAEEVTALVDAATDTLDFVTASEEAMRKEQQLAFQGIDQQNLAMVVGKGGNMARMANRVVQVAKGEADNSEDPEFKHCVSSAAVELDKGIQPLVLSTKAVAMNPKMQPVQIEFKQTSDGLIARVVDIKKALEPELPPPPPPVPDVSQLQLEEAKAKVAAEVPPARPPPPIVEGLIAADESRELHSMLRQPESDNRIAVAAHQLHVEASKWEEEGNLLIQTARKMAMLFAKMSLFISDEEYCNTHSKRELIDTAKMITVVGKELNKHARDIALKCPDKRMKHDLLVTIDRIPTISTQLKILATVKATMFGANDPQADLEATEMLVGCAENLLGSARSVVKDCEAASIKIRAGQGIVTHWKRETDRYY